jgi:hypothetical protein
MQRLPALILFMCGLIVVFPFAVAESMTLFGLPPDSVLHLNFYVMQLQPFVGLFLIGWALIAIVRPKAAPHAGSPRGEKRPMT